MRILDSPHTWQCKQTMFLYWGWWYDSLFPMKEKPKHSVVAMASLIPKPLQHVCHFQFSTHCVCTLFSTTNHRGCYIAPLLPSPLSHVPKPPKDSRLHWITRDTVREWGSEGVREWGRRGRKVWFPPPQILSTPLTADLAKGLGRD